MALIGDYAAIGDGRTAALVSRVGSIDWLCWPRADCAPLFAALVDGERGGAFRVGPAGPSEPRRRYLAETNVLETTHRTADGVCDVTDFMPAEAPGLSPDLRPENEVVRLVRCLAGTVEIEARVAPRGGFGGRPLVFENRAGFGWRADAGAGEVRVASEIPLARDGADLAGRRRLRAGERARVSLTYGVDAPAVAPASGDGVEAALESTCRVWRRWIAGCAYEGPFGDAVRRSALTLKLLTFAPSGAVLAAATTSLPEAPGGELNWDYRFCWLRDAAFTMRALLSLGFADEAGAFASWQLHATRLTRPRLRILYDVFGRVPPRERELWQLAGYAGARPVRVGNAAANQLQLDVYGEIADATARTLFAGGRSDADTRRFLTGLARFVCNHWREPDHGIWELRGAPRHYTHSKLLCWVALDRLLNLHAHGLLGADFPAGRARRERAALEAAIRARAWSERRGAYVQAFGGDALDASVLLMPWYGFERADSPRMAATYARVERELGAGGGLYRFHAPAVGEGTFVACGFWAAEYLALAGRADEAHARIERLLGFANDVGLFAEEYDVRTGEALGNVPQGYSHVGLVNAVLSLAEARGRIAGDETGRTTGRRGHEEHGRR